MSINQFLSNGQLSSLTVRLVLINVLAFLIVSYIPGVTNTAFGFGALYSPANPHFGFWQLISSMFMHGDLPHLFFNMFVLWMFGSLLEELWGKKKFLIFYFISGVGAGLLHILVSYYQFNQIYQQLVETSISTAEIQNLLETGRYSSAWLNFISEEKLEEIYLLHNTPAVGASGAIYGILAAFGIMFPNAKMFFLLLPVPIAAKYLIPALIAIDLLSGITGFSLFGGNIAHFAHVGGAIVGAVLTLFWKRSA